MSIMQTLNLQSANVTNQAKKVFTSAQMLRIQNLRKRIVIRKGFTA